MPTTVDDLAARFVPQAWMRDAACRTHDPDLWFPDRGQSGDKALRVCSRCPVRAECLEYARAERIDVGIWGGMTARQRKRGRGYAC